ncbi:hypothetical protein HUO13_33765 [Saccharopolyspora erythraea]|uniref:anti-sigma-D factor RsdA n=1 Tax=Saccharopolyspora erythraea TaxID=1836 RepID=UPI001BA52CC1|nr:anti-sigma-D factor RsdA [Saccharopolyspora erythraea]QUH05083.1 hypothetical protein HUO13_33765 [Saccharopolyspora erythraea]
MAERKGPGGEEAGHDRVESGQQDDRSRVEDDREALPGSADAGDRTELNENHRVSDSAESGTTGTRNTASGRQDAAGLRVSGPRDAEESGGTTEHAIGAADSHGTRAQEPATGADEWISVPQEQISAADVAGDDVSRGEESAQRAESGSDKTSDGSAAAAERSDRTAEVIAFRPRPDADADELVALDEGEEGERVDLSELQADDALLDMLGGTNPDVPAAGGDPTLDALLVAWRQDIDAAPIGELVDVDTAVATIAEARRPRRRLKRRHLVPVASAAAVLMITFTGVGLAARDAMPGDALWGVAQVLYTDHARMAQAASSAKDDLHRAEGALDLGDRNSAEAALDRAHDMMQDVDAEHGLDDLQAAHASLTARMGEDGTGSPDSPSSSTELSSSSSVPQPPPSGSVPPPPTPPTSTPSTTPSTSTQPTETSSRPSETSGSGSTDHPSSNTGPSWGSGLFPSN